VLVVAKSPVPGLAKTRLAATVGPAAAADIAAAALLDTLDAARASGAVVVVALTGDLGRAARRAEVAAALRAVTVIDQRGDGLGQRLANAHADAHARAAVDARASADTAAGAPDAVDAGSSDAVFQIGMDTPQVTPQLLVEALTAAARQDAVLGPADDGGWWGLAVAEARLAQVLGSVPMSTDRTCALTRAALEAAGAEVHLLPVLRDVDDWADAQAVAVTGGSRFAAAVAATRPIHAGGSVEPLS
jgi:glycosyltransferase A (GT-A) superfamily protein (DUF2064 family)